MILPFFFCHRKNYSFLFFHSRSIKFAVSKLSLHSRNHFYERLNRTHFLYLLKLKEHIFKRELVSCHFTLKFFCFFLIYSFLRFFYKRNDIAHSKNSSGNSIRVERFKIFCFFSCTDKQNRLSCNRF